jgi:uncharacterized protein involved in response to NO
MLTAVPSWTATAPLAGRPLGALAALWFAGRVALWLEGSVPALVVAAVDVAFLPVLAVVVSRPLIAARKPHNLVFLALLAALTAGNALVHAEAVGLHPNSAATGLRLGVVTVTLMVAMIGGRVVPAFTQNALAARPGGPAKGVVRSVPLDRAAILATVAFAVAEIGWPGTLVAAFAALAAGLAHAARLAGWRTRDTLTIPILWVLHLGYGWLVIGLLVVAAAGLTEAVPPAAALHGLTTGAFGTMTLAIMSRAALGHTGRPLVAAPATVAAYLLVSLAALLRVAVAPWQPDANLVAGAAWVAAFALFAATHAPMLIAPRADA